MPASHFTAVSILLLALAACSPYQLADPPSDPTMVPRPFTAYLDGVASVCVIRSTQAAMATTFVVHDNDSLVGATRGPSWFCYRAEPGRHKISVRGDDGEQRFDVDLDPRGRYYLDQGVVQRSQDLIPRCVWVDEATAAGLLQNSEHRVLQGAPASESLLVGTDIVAAVPP